MLAKRFFSFAGPLRYRGKICSKIGHLAGIFCVPLGDTPQMRVLGKNTAATLGDDTPYSANMARRPLP
ncbi:MAG: hypothetical protein Q4A62_04075 [Eikenella sp.]|nr:hypothetical protein [Eikenella sp.]